MLPIKPTAKGTALMSVTATRFPNESAVRTPCRSFSEPRGTQSCTKRNRTTKHCSASNAPTATLRMSAGTIPYGRLFFRVAKMLQRTVDDEDFECATLPLGDGGPPAMRRAIAQIALLVAAIIVL